MGARRVTRWGWWASIALLVGCGGDSLAERERVALSTDDRTGIAVEVDLILPDQVAPGDSVPIAVRLRNPDARPVTLGLTGRPVAWDVVVTREDGAEVWRRLHGTMAALVLQLLRIEPGDSIEFADHWGQVDNAGRRVPPGRYSVQGRIPAEDRELVTDARALVIAR